VRAFARSRVRPLVTEGCRPFVPDPLSRLIPTRANGQPAFGRYLSDPHAPVGHAHGLIVITLAEDRISVITGFHDNSVLARFGLPRTLPE
jgi:hypothetical protein